MKYLKKVYTPLIEYAQKELKDYIKEVRISLRLVDTPVVIVADMMNDTPNRERLEAASSMRTNAKYHKEKNILEINPHSPLIQSLNKIVEVTLHLFRTSPTRTALSSSRICTTPHSYTPASLLRTLNTSPRMCSA